MKNKIFTLYIIALSFLNVAAKAQSLLSSLKDPVLFAGNDSTAYRDPAVIYQDRKFYLFFTLCKIESDGRVYSYLAMSVSDDLKKWSPEKILTPKDQDLDYSSPGNIIRFNKEWIICLQTYPRTNYTKDKMPRFGDNRSRLYIMKSKDLINWGAPELLKVKGPTTSIDDMGRMIDPYLLEDKDEKGKWWCFYKQNGVSKSYSYDLKNWVYSGHAEAGENVCLIVKDHKYLLFNSPANGISIKEASDLNHFEDWGVLITLGQANWNWAKGRLTAGAAIDLTQVEGINRYLMFFHGSGPLTEDKGDFDKNSSIGICWSDDLRKWNWPGKN